MSHGTAGTMRLDLLLAGMAPAPRVVIGGLALDSRAIRSGDAFVALGGSNRHGLAYLAQAAAAGAQAVLWDPAEGAAPGIAPDGVALVPVAGLRGRLGAIADRFFGAPSSRLAVAGVTGTNGKTTCAWLLAGAAAGRARRAAYLGTLGAGFPPHVAAGALTTPDVITLHRQLR